MFCEEKQRKSGKCNPVFVPKLFKPLERFLWRKVYLFFVHRKYLIGSDAQISTCLQEICSIIVKGTNFQYQSHINITNNHKHYKHILRGRYCLAPHLISSVFSLFLFILLLHICENVFPYIILIFRIPLRVLHPTGNVAERDTRWNILLSLFYYFTSNFHLI